MHFILTVHVIYKMYGYVNNSNGKHFLQNFCNEFVLMMDIVLSSDEDQKQREIVKD